jgi:hypothetical protein
MRIARSPSTNEGMTALHIAAQSGRTDLVRYLIEKGANTEITDINGRKAVDLLVGAAAAGTPAAPAAAPARGRGGPQAAASSAEIRTLLENAARK